MARIQKKRARRSASSPGRRIVYLLGLFLGGVVFLLILALGLPYVGLDPLFGFGESDKKITQVLLLPDEELIAEGLDPVSSLDNKSDRQKSEGLGKRDPFRPMEDLSELLQQVVSESKSGKARKTDKVSAKASENPTGQEKFTFYQSLTDPSGEVDDMTIPKKLEKQAKAASRPSPLRKVLSSPTSKFTLQVGSFAEKNTAQSLVTKLVRKGYSAYWVEAQLESLDIRYRVRVGRFSDKTQAKSFAERLAKKEGLQSYITFAQTDQ